MSTSRRSILGGLIGLGLSLGLWRRVVAQEAVSYTYDALGRVRTVTYGGNVITYTYDPATAPRSSRRRPRRPRLRPHHPLRRHHLRHHLRRRHRLRRLRPPSAPPTGHGHRPRR